jgi:hypothetical protein
MIKKITFITVAFVYCSFFVNAQINEGSLLIGGQVYYNNVSGKTSEGGITEKTSNGVIDLSLGKAIKDNVVVGVHLEFVPGSTGHINNGIVSYKTKVNGYGGGVFYRKYKTLAKDFYFFIEAGANYLYERQTTRDTAGNKVQMSTYSAVQLSLAPGISYKVLKNLHMEVMIPGLLTLQYEVDKASSISQSASQNKYTFNTNINASTLNNISVGFRLIF